MKCEMFRRQNSGKPLNNKLLRIVHESDELSDAIYDLSTTPFMDKLLSNTQRKNGTDRQFDYPNSYAYQYKSD